MTGQVLLPGVARVVFAHAHPDDETLATGALIAELVDRGVECLVLTATRGERGEVVPGPLAALAGTSALVAHRETELAGALAELGVAGHVFLGNPPARAAGLAPRRYRDSGMRWIRPGVAGPAVDSPAGPAADRGQDLTADRSGAEADGTFTAADPGESGADLTAYLQLVRPDAVVTYDETGGYGHPDHVRMHEICRDACARLGIALVEVLPGGAGSVQGSQEDSPDRAMGEIEVVDLAHRLPVVAAALRCHASQLSVADSEVIHVGGQREPILTQVRLRRRQ